MISVVIETENLSIASQDDLLSVLRAIEAQSYPRNQIEVIAVVEASNDQLASTLEHRYSGVRVVKSDEPSYYGMKTCGIRAANGEIVALLDSDCIPSPEWAASMAASISAGADVAAGKTRYARDKRFARTFDLFQFGHVRLDAHGQATGFIVNNVGFRSSVLREHIFDPQLASRRTGAGYVFGRKLKALGFRIAYNPRQRVTHVNHGLRYHLLNRLRAGFELVNQCQMDRDDLMSEKKYMRLGVFAPLVFALRRFIYDVQLLRTNRDDLDIPLYAVPYHVAASLLVRTIEMVGALTTLARPAYFIERYGW